ncbi:MAG: rod shape-determining protein MreD [Gemmatimonadota bacterium]
MERRTLGLVLSVAALVLLDLAVVPVLGGRVVLDLLLIAVVAAAGRVRPGVAALIGFAFGVLRDSTAPDAFGASALALSIVAYGVSRLSAGAFEERLAATAAVLATARVVSDVLAVLVAGRLHGTELLLRLLWWAPVGAVVTTVVGVFVLRLLPPPVDLRRGRR